MQQKEQIVTEIFVYLEFYLYFRTKNKNKDIYE